MAHDTSRKSQALGFGLIMVMFAIWGLSHRLYETIFPGFVASLQLDEFHVSLTHWVRVFGYILIAIPSAFILRNLGYKAGVIGGLGIFAVAMFMFYPAEMQHSYLFFLCAGLLANFGVALLEIAADPWVMMMGRPETAIRRLNIAQTINPLGLLVGMVLGERLMQVSAHPAAATSHSLPQPYIMVGVGVLLFAYVIDKVHYSPLATERAAKDDRTVTVIRTLVANPRFRFGLAALALYIMGHTVLWGSAARYAESAAGGAFAAPDILSWTLYAFIIGRVAGTALMYRFAPLTLLKLFSAAAAGLVAAAAVLRGWPGIWCVVAASFFMSILFPTIFGLAVQGLEKSIKTASALLIMASGSANLVSPTIGLIWGTAFTPYILLLPCLCFGVIAVFALTREVPSPAPQVAPV